MQRCVVLSGSGGGDRFRILHRDVVRHVCWRFRPHSGILGFPAKEMHVRKRFTVRVSADALVRRHAWIGLPVMECPPYRCERSRSPQSYCEVYECRPRLLSVSWICGHFDRERDATTVLSSLSNWSITLIFLLHLSVGNE